jgi:hypothetical protein
VVRSGVGAFMAARRALSPRAPSHAAHLKNLPVKNCGLGAFMATRALPPRAPSHLVTYEAGFALSPAEGKEQKPISCYN